MNMNVVNAIADEVGGYDNIVGIRCANGTKFYFGRYALKQEDFVNMGGLDILKLKHKDSSGREAVSYLDVDEIVQVYTVLDLEKGITLRDILD